MTAVTGEAIAENILKHLTDWQLPPSRLCGQSYDGVGAMAGKNKGAATRITQQYPKALRLYTHIVLHMFLTSVLNVAASPRSETSWTLVIVSHFFAFSQLAFERLVDGSTAW